MKTYALDHNTGSFEITEKLRIKLDGEDMINMGWNLSDDESPETEFALTITTAVGKMGNRILLEMLASNNEWVSTANPYDFVFIDAIQDLIRHGYLMIADEYGNEVENGTLQIKA